MLRSEIALGAGLVFVVPLLALIRQHDDRLDENQRTYWTKWRFSYALAAYAVAVALIVFVP